MENKNYKLIGDWERGSYYKQNTIVIYGNKQYLVINPCRFESSIEPNKDSFNYKLLFDNQEPKSIQEQIVENLEEEIKSLSKVIVKTRESGEYGTYKNLITSLKGVLELYNQEKGENNNIINTNISLNLNDLIKIDSDGNIEVIKGSVNELPNIKEISENVLKELKNQLNKRGLGRQLNINK
jgi:hypothetical protein